MSAGLARALVLNSLILKNYSGARIMHLGRIMRRGSQHLHDSVRKQREETVHLILNLKEPTRSTLVLNGSESIRSNHLSAPKSHVEIRDLAAGLWIWRTEHPGWKPDADWQPVVTSTCVESGGERLVLDPLAPPADATGVEAT